MPSIRLLTLLLFAAAVPVPVRAAEAPREVDFAQDVYPIFKARCFSCHGDEAQEGELRLDQRATALRGGAGGAIIVSGKSAESPLIERVTSTDPDLRMPQGDGKPLSEAEVGLLRSWIDQGAKWPEGDIGRDHWSLKPLVRPAVPTSGQAASAHHPIDAFVRAKLDEHQLTPSPEADRRTLIRRLFFDLTGLGPTPEEVTAFLADTAPNAYEQLIDRLLASPRYGERWARHWIDVVHFAETHGHDQDRPRPNAWPYRDYLIRSFNDDKPYARFVSEQVAGDVLFPDDPQATVGLGLLASGPWDESTLMSIQDDTIDRKVGQVLDRDDMIATVMSTFNGATVHCARCHNHKFDPITQADYYALQSVFAGVDRTERPVDVDSTVYSRRRELTRRKQELEAQTPAWFADAAQQAQAVEIEPQFVAGRETWRILSPVSFTAENGSTATPQPDGSLLIGGPRPEKDTYTFVFEGEFQSVSAVQLEVLADAILPLKGPGRQDNGNLHLSEFNVLTAPLTGGEAKTLAVSGAVADYDQQGWTVKAAIDGKPETAWGIYPEVSKSHAAVFILGEPVPTQGKSRLTVVLKQLHGGGHLIGRPRISVTSSVSPGLAKPLSVEVLAILDTPVAARTVEQKTELARFLLAWHVDRELASLPRPQLVYAAANRASSTGNPIMPPAEPREVRMLRRGDIKQPLEVAAPGTLSCIDGLESRFSLENPKDEGARRAALARWLSDSKNVLTWRSIVNRAWHYHFGRGLVDTPNDLGKMGGTPSHPDLLDWLAVEFRDSGGSLKKLHKLILTSETYRQTSKNNADYARIDGDNRFLWRMNASRLDAESIRDTVLQISGKLDLTMGGPSVKQFIESPGIHVTPNVDYQSFDIDAPAQFRRSIYRFLFRTLPDPFMASMDCPDGSQWSPTRSASVTALQALTMLNDRFIVRQSEHVANRLTQAASVPSEQIRLLFQLALTRDPEGAEGQAWEQYAAKHGLPNACRVMFNTNEFLFAR